MVCGSLVGLSTSTESSCLAGWWFEGVVFECHFCNFVFVSRSKSSLVVGWCRRRTALKFVWFWIPYSECFVCLSISPYSTVEIQKWCVQRTEVRNSTSICSQNLRENGFPPAIHGGQTLETNWEWSDHSNYLRNNKNESSSSDLVCCHHFRIGHVPSITALALGRPRLCFCCWQSSLCPRKCITQQRWKNS